MLVQTKLGFASRHKRVIDSNLLLIPSCIATGCVIGSSNTIMLHGVAIAVSAITKVPVSAIIVRRPDTLLRMSPLLVRTLIRVLLVDSEASASTCCCNGLTTLISFHIWMRCMVHLRWKRSLRRYTVHTWSLREQLVGIYIRIDSMLDSKEISDHGAVFISPFLCTRTLLRLVSHLRR